MILNKEGKAILRVFLSLRDKISRSFFDYSEIRLRLLQESKSKELDRKRFYFEGRLENFNLKLKRNAGIVEYLKKTTEREINLFVSFSITVPKQVV